LTTITTTITAEAIDAARQASADARRALTDGGMLGRSARERALRSALSAEEQTIARFRAQQTALSGRLASPTVLTADDLDLAAQGVKAARARLVGAGAQDPGLREAFDAAVGVEMRAQDRYADQQERLAVRAELERANAADIKRLGRDISKSHEAAVAAVADGRLVTIVDALAARNGAVAAAHARLTELGMPSSDGIVEYGTGWCSSLSAMSVTIGGTLWTAAPLDVVAVRLVGRALERHLGAANAAVAWSRSYGGGTMATSAARALLAELATAEPAQRPAA
jgi:hypothetical protein